MEHISRLLSWFLQNFTSEEISMSQLIVTMGMAVLVSIYIFFVYRLLTRKTIYSLRYNIMVAGMVLIITAIIFSVQSSVVLSLGVMGALSIVRFRTAIKEPLDIVFLFWSITAGLCIGAHMSEIAIIMSAFVTILIFLLEEISVKRKSRLLLIEYAQPQQKEMLLQEIRKECKSCVIKAQNQGKEGHRLILEIKCKDEYRIFKAINALQGIQSVSLVSHEGESSF